MPTSFNYVSGKFDPAVFDPAVFDTTQTQNLTASLYTDADTFYAASIALGAVTLQPSLFTDADTFYSANINQAGSAQTLAASLYTDADTFFAATITQPTLNQILQASLFTDPDSFYSPIISGGASQVFGALNNGVVTQSRRRPSSLSSSRRN